MKETEIADCPRCGCESEAADLGFWDENRNPKGYAARCLSVECGLSTEAFASKADLLKWWAQSFATAREARLVEALEHYEDPAHWSQIRNNNGNGEFLPVRYSDGNNPNAHGRDVAAIALNENIVRCSHGFDVLNDAGETIGHFDTATAALAEYRGGK